MILQKNRNKPYFFILIILTLIGATIRILAASHIDIEHDEWHTLRFSTQDNLKEFFADKFGKHATIDHNPGYFLISYFYFKFVTPASKLAVRFPALFFGILSIPVLFFVVRRFFGEKVALTAVVLVTFNFFHILYSKQAGPYSLLMFLTILSIYYFIKILTNGYGLNSRGKLLFVNVIMYLVHPVSLLFTITEYFYLYIKLIFELKKPRKIKSLFVVFFKNFLLESIVFLSLFFIVNFPFQQTGWISKPGMGHLISVYAIMLQYSYFITTDCYDCNLPVVIEKSIYYMIFIAFSLFLVLFLIVFFCRKQKLRSIINFKNQNLFMFFLLTVVLLLPLITFLVSQIKPLLVLRYMSFMFIPLILMISLIFGLLNDKVRLYLLFIIVGIAIYSSFQSLEFNSSRSDYNDELFEYLRETNERAILGAGANNAYSDVILEYYKKNKNFDYDNIISFENLDTNENYNEYFYIKDWFLYYSPRDRFTNGQRLRYFEDNITAIGCDFSNFKLRDTDRSEIRKIICQNEK